MQQFPGATNFDPIKTEGFVEKKGFDLKGLRIQKFPSAIQLAALHQNSRQIDTFLFKNYYMVPNHYLIPFLTCNSPCTTNLIQYLI